MSGAAACTCSAKSNINQPTPDVVAANPGVNLDALRPYKGYNSIRETDNVASSMYNSLQFSWNKRFSQRLAVRRRLHALSKSMDDGSDPARHHPQHLLTPHNLWGQSDFDVRHIFIANYLYELPFFRDNNHLRGQAARRLADQRHDPVPVRHPCGIAVGTDYAGVGQDGSLSTAADSCGSKRRRHRDRPRHRAQRRQQ